MLISAVLFGSFSCPSEAKMLTGSLPEGEWAEHKSTHFIIYYYPSIDEDYIKEFSGKCEEYYEKITERLGFKRVDFWLWEDRAKVFVYKDREGYLMGTGRSAWSGASVSLKEKYMNTFYFEGDFFDVILPHELAHIILREFIGIKTVVPLWFDEGVAGANEKDSLVRYLMVAKRMVAREEFIPINNLESISYSKVMVPRVFYPTAAAIVIFLFENKKWGGEKFFEFCSGLREMKKIRGDTFYKVMRKVYGIADAEQLNTELLKYLEGQKYEDIAAKQNFDVNW